MNLLSKVLRNLSSDHDGRRSHGSSRRSDDHGGHGSARQQTVYSGSAGDCASCRTPLAPGAKFCAECGALAASSICRSCSAPLAKSARFCAGCGTSVS
ncbi:zinc ribbon domain-containing protein [Variovorax sp. PAMC 28711]|uniref:zinc ribbon domain-containing protein n=1 Tax=Variovorax sp. PAMC 28711 TaxID=1795631 RepID=UPI0009EBE758|nr:zinc ribbon domain-containing protein [Variovorax sp. PAMC 28711]